MPFDPVFSEEFEPQETDPFTLTGQGQVTNLGDFYILSPLSAQSLETLQMFQNLDPSVFSSPSFKTDLLMSRKPVDGRSPLRRA